MGNLLFLMVVHDETTENEFNPEEIEEGIG